MSETSCLFCSIIKRQIKADIIAENNLAIAFLDINPQAPNHILIIPKIHMANLNNINNTHSEYLLYIILLAQEIAKKYNINNSGYRLVINNGPDAQQTVGHLHAHILGGRKFSWPPG